MRASALILVQRYLDGDLSELELQAFKEDLVRDAQLAWLLEQEVRIDASIIDDVYSIEPPTHLRSSILDVLPPSKEHLGRMIPQHAVVSTILSTLMLFVMIGDIGNRSVPIDRTSAEAVVAGSTVVVAPRNRMSTKTISQTHNQTHDVDKHHRDQPVDEHVVHPVQLAEVTVGERATVSDASARIETLSPSMNSFPMSVAEQTAGLQLLASTNTVSASYELGNGEDVQLFVEAGVLQQRYAAAMYVNGISSAVNTTTLAPFVALGVRGALFHVDMVDRTIHASASVGVSQLGPLVMADLSTSLLSIGATSSVVSLDIGIRLASTFNSRAHLDAHVNVAPFIRMGIPMR